MMMMKLFHQPFVGESSLILFDSNLMSPFMIGEFKYLLYPLFTNISEILLFSFFFVFKLK
jgi:hypothetical protein